jgi:hypothetical protein
VLNGACNTLGGGGGDWYRMLGGSS